MGTSLWLVPNSDGANSDAVKLERIMNRRSPTATSPSSFPRFKPHVTLTTVPSDTPESVLRDVVQSWRSKVPIDFVSVDVGDKYFMSVYVTANQETPELVQLRELVARELGEKTVPPVAHLSLFYIDDSDADERVKIAGQLREDGRIIEGNGFIQLDCTEGDARGEDMVGGFVGDEIWVALCDGPVESWQVLGDKIKL